MDRIALSIIQTMGKIDGKINLRMNIWKDLSLKLSESFCIIIDKKVRFNDFENIFRQIPENLLVPA